MANEQSLVIKINGDIKGYEDALKQVGKDTESLQRNLASLAKQSAIAFTGFAGAITFAASKAAKFETIETQFEVLTGSVEKAKKTVAELAKFAADTPFVFPEVAKAGKQLLSFQVTGDKLLPTLKNLGDVASAMGTPFNDLVLVFGQVKAAGKLTGERLAQLEEKAVPIGPALAKTMGVAESAIRGMVSKGQVSFNIFEKALESISAEGGQAFEGMIKQSKTAEGRISTLAGNFDFAAAAIGRTFLPLVKTLTGALSNFFKLIGDNPALADFISKGLVVGTVASATLVTVSLLGLGFLKLRTAIIASTLATKGLSFAVKGLVGATGLGLLVAFLPEILSAFDTVWTGAVKIVEKAGGSIVKAASAIGKVMVGFLTFSPAKIIKGLLEFKTAFVEVAQNTSAAFEDQTKTVEDSEAKKTAAVKKGAAERKEINKKETESVSAEIELRRQKIREEIEIIEAKNDSLEKQEIDFIQRRQKLREQDRQAGMIQDETEKALALERNQLLFDQLIFEELDYYISKDELAATQREKEVALAEELAETDKETRNALRQEEKESLMESTQTNEKIRSKAAAQVIQSRRKELALQLQDEMKHGKTVATFRALMRSEEINNARTAANELSQLQNSENSKMREIGKAAALVQIAIDTQRGALAAYTALAGIPVVGPGLGIVAAGALTAYGVERAQRVQAAQSGGIVEGRGFGDSVPFLLEPGELVTPRQNFEEVVGAVAAQRAGGVNNSPPEPGESTTQMVEIGFDGDEAADVLTVKQNEQRALGISQET